jgi:hypothetical protein
MDYEFEKIVNFLRFRRFIGENNIRVLSGLLGKTGSKFFFEIGDEKAIHLMCEPEYKIRYRGREILCDSIVFSTSRNKVFIRNRGELDAAVLPLKKVTHYGLIIDDMEGVLRKGVIQEETIPTSFFFKKEGGITKTELKGLLEPGFPDLGKDGMRLEWIALKSDRDIISFYRYATFVSSIEAAGFAKRTCKSDEAVVFMRQLYGYFQLKETGLYLREDFSAKSKKVINSNVYFSINLA